MSHRCRQHRPPGGRLRRGLTEEDSGPHFDPESTRAALAYKLNPDNLHRFLDATKTITALVNNDPIVKGQFRDFGNFVKQPKGKSSLDAWTAALEQRVPTAAAAIRKAGLTPHDYLLVLIVIGEEAVDMAFPSTEKLSPEVSPENAAFVRAHSKEIGEVTQPFDRAMKSLESRKPR